MSKLFTISLLCLSLFGCRAAEVETHALPIEVVETLSADAMQGREAGTEGVRMAQAYLEGVIADIGTGKLRVQPFEVDGVAGNNLLVRVDGTGDPEPLLVVMAHYDHVGVREDGEVFNGADDNASGVGGLVAILQSFAHTPPEHTVLVAFLDAEEGGLFGARALVPTLPDRPVAALNFDMIAQNPDGVIYAAGTHHTPELKPVMERAGAASDMELRFGHDRPEDGADDWTMQSDHAAFHAADLPFIYLGVEDHPHYHKVTDEFATLPLDVYRHSLDLAVAAAREMDAALPELARLRTPFSPAP